MKSKHWDMWVSTCIEDFTALRFNVVLLAFAKKKPKKNMFPKTLCEDLHIESWLEFHEKKKSSVSLDNLIWFQLQINKNYIK